MKHFLIGVLTLASLSTFASSVKIKLQTLTVSDNYDAKSDCEDYAENLKLFSNSEIAFTTKCVSQLQGTEYEKYARNYYLHAEATILQKSKVVKLSSITVSDYYDARSKCEEFEPYIHMFSNSKIKFSTKCISQLQGSEWENYARNFFLVTEAEIMD